MSGLLKPLSQGFSDAEHLQQTNQQTRYAKFHNT